MMDFEGSASSGVVEFGVVTLLHGGIVKAESALCAPTGAISAVDEDVHGIRAGDVAGKAPFSGYYDQFVAYRQSGVLAAHNRHAENNFLKSTWPLPRSVPDWRTGTGLAQEWGPWIDTLAIYKSLYPGLDSYSLGELVLQFRLQDELLELAGVHCPDKRKRAHCALYDALASSLLLIRLGNEESLSPYLSLGWLLQLSSGRSPQQELF